LSISRPRRAVGLRRASSIPAIYSIGKGSGYNSDFHDITLGDNDDVGSPLYYNSVAGFDLVAGWGSPNSQKLIDALA
jgi:hypothetical protein